MHLKRRWIDRRVYEYFSVNLAPWLGWRNPILIYQMGKVGSSSIRNSLFRCSDPTTRLVLMSHEFYPIRNRDIGRIKIDAELQPHVIREIEHDRQVYTKFSWRKRLGWRFREKYYTQRIYQAYVKPGGPLRVITLVREPVANNISMYFQLLDHYFDPSRDPAQIGVEELISVFVNQYMHSRPITWLDAELKTTLGVDVYHYPFSIDKGYNVISKDNVSLLVIRCELDDESKATAIGDFLGLRDFKIIRSNVTSDKDHAKQYASFKQNIRIPQGLLDELYNSKYAKFFYSEQERSRFRLHWAGEHRQRC